MTLVEMIRKRGIWRSATATPATIATPVTGETPPLLPIAPALIPPILPGWLVTYWDTSGKLCGGFDDRTHGTVRECLWEGNGWTVHLTDGQRLPLSIIRAVGQTDATGKIIGAWTIKAHGYDGGGPV